VLGWNGFYWYGVFKNFNSNQKFNSFIISLTTGTQTFFSEQYQIETDCETLTKISVVYPYNYNAEDVNGIYIGQPGAGQTVAGIPTMFYRHNFWTRQGEVVETSNKISFTSNRYKNFATTLNKSFEFRPELVPGWYKDYLLSVYFRGDIMINDVHAIVTELNFEDVDVDYWKAYAVIGKQVIGGFGCSPYNLADVDCVPAPPPVCVPVSFVTNFGNAVSGKPYSNIIVLSGTGPFTLSDVNAPLWIKPSFSGNNLIWSGTPAESDEGNPAISFTVSNNCGNQPFNGNIEVDPPPVGVYFGPTTFVSGDALNESEIANLVGTPDVTVTVVLDTLNNSNGGKLLVSGQQVFQGYRFDVLLDGEGKGSMNVSIQGVDISGSVILGHFIILSVSSGTIGSPDSYQISKVF
jgi:hypothetical protein